MELYEQLLSIRICAAYKTRTSDQINTTCRCAARYQRAMLMFWGDVHRLRRLKVQFFEMLGDLKLVDSFPPWYSRVDPKQSEDHNRMLVSTQNTLSFEPTGWTHNL